MWRLLQKTAAFGVLMAAMLLLTWTVVPHQFRDVSTTLVEETRASFSTAATNIKQSLSNFQRRKLQEMAANAAASTTKTTTTAQKQQQKQHQIITIFTNANTDGFSRKQREVMQDELLLGDADAGNGRVIANSTEDQHAFLVAHPCVPGVAERFEVLTKSNHSQRLAEEVWKYCALYLHGGLYLDSDSPILKASALQQLLYNNRNLAVLMDSFAPSSMHGSLLFLNQPKSNVALEMARLLVTTDLSVLTASPLLLPRTLHDLIAKEAQALNNKNNNNQADSTKETPHNQTNAIHNLQAGKNGPWHILQQSCSEDPFRTHSDSEPAAVVPIDAIHPMHMCSPQNGLCCLIYTGRDDERVAILASRTPTYPVHNIVYADLPMPYNNTFQTQKADENEGAFVVAEELPYLATAQLETTNDNAVVDSSPTTRVLTLYEQLKEKDCLPSTSCNKCLGNKQDGATCETCREACPCYCKALCQEDAAAGTVKDKHRYQHSTVRMPKYARDPTRLIPRIVHQTWFEALNPEKYPNMSRLTESFQNSGWEYKFYTDDEAGSFLAEHFPPQVREAYELLIPGAFKADLFRYCVLLIRGGVYADVDTMMGPSLDAAIPKDVGFMVGLDEPGKKIGNRMCLWNGFIASAPGHPFLAKVIETTVNNIHQRFTSVDVAGMHCPAPEMSIITSFSPLFIAGPCMLGSSMNNVLDRHGQTQFEAGELAHPNKGLNIPGRTIILDQNKNDMGAHRFTFQEQNLIVLSTDFPDSDDREKLDGVEHYSNTRIRFEIYAVDSVYKDSERSDGPLIRLNTE